MSAPVITTQPTDQTVDLGGSAHFFVVVTSNLTNKSFQWYKNEVAIAGATKTSYATPATILADDGAQFKVKCTNNDGFVISNTVTLTVVDAPPPPPPPDSVPVITVQPESKDVAVGVTATFSVEAEVEGGGTLHYIWFKNGVALDPNVDAPMYTTPPATLDDDGTTYQVQVFHEMEHITSDLVVLSVIDIEPPPEEGPEITTQPQDATVGVGFSAIFTVVATPPPFVFQWLRNGLPIDGANNNHYTTPPATSENNHDQYTVQVTNSQGTVLSDIAELTVTEQPPSELLPVITVQPTDAAVALGQTARFSVQATGTGPFTYQWLLDGVPIIGATNWRFQTQPSVLTDDGSSYSVVVSNLAGSITSATAVLTVSTDALPADDSSCCTIELTYLWPAHPNGTESLATPTEKSAMLAFLESYAPVGESLVISDPVRVTLQLKLTIIARAGYDAVAIRQQILANVIKLTQQLGAPFHVGDLYTAILAVEGIVRPYIFYPISDRAQEWNEYIYLDQNYFNQNFTVIYNLADLEMPASPPLITGYVEPVIPV